MNVNGMKTQPASRKSQARTEPMSSPMKMSEDAVLYASPDRSEGGTIRIWQVYLIRPYMVHIPDMAISNFPTMARDLNTSMCSGINRTGDPLYIRPDFSPFHHLLPSSFTEPSCHKPKSSSWVAESLGLSLPHSSNSRDINP
jgi:hypothetical protein